MKQGDKEGEVMLRLLQQHNKGTQSRGLLEMDGDRYRGIGASSGRHKLTAYTTYIHRNRDAEGTNRDALGGSPSS